MTQALERVAARAVATPQTIGQQTAVEQARAVAEVAAAVQVARQFPRDVVRIKAEIAEACADYDVAREAFYAVQNRGEGLSVHIARELARIWGNFQYGVHELRRDDAAGESEVQAFAWDVETNTRSSRTFVNPHVRMKDGRRMPLVDVQDVYLSNQNTGARAVRECILSSLPKWLVNDADRRCRATIEAGDPKDRDKPIEERRQNAVDLFARGNVTKAQLEKRVGKPVGQWTAQELAALAVLYDSLRRGDTTKEEAFGESAGDGQPRVTAGDIKDQAKPKAPQRRMARMHALFRDHGREGDEQVREGITEILGRPIASRTELTADEVETVIAYLEQTGPPPPDGDEPPPDEGGAS